MCTHLYGKCVKCQSEQQADWRGGRQALAAIYIKKVHGKASTKPVQTRSPVVIPSYKLCDTDQEKHDLVDSLHSPWCELCMKHESNIQGSKTFSRARITSSSNHKQGAWGKWHVSSGSVYCLIKAPIPPIIEQQACLPVQTIILVM